MIESTPRTVLKRAATFVSLMALAAGCSHTRPVANPTDSGADLSEASVVIRYVLRHADRKISFETHDSSVHGESLMDGAKLKSCQIDTKHYSDFIRKVADFVQKHRVPASEHTPAPATECRAPYSIIFKIHGDTTEVRGCRVSDEGAFSHLVQDGEFLIYRQK